MSHTELAREAGIAKSRKLLIGGSILGLLAVGGLLPTACAIMSNLSLMSYFAVLFFSGLISGILIGILAYSIEKRLPADFR